MKPAAAGNLEGMEHGEDALVDWLRRRFGTDRRRVPLGIGDDMAAVRFRGTLVAVTADMLLDGVHFNTAEHEPEQIGRKAAACSLSDCAACACEPRFATVSLAVPADAAPDWIRRIMDGIGTMAERYGCLVVGGDTTAWSGRLVIDVAMLAEPMAARGPVTRSEARPRDMLFVSGELGGSLLGKHMDFEPRLDLARKLAGDPAMHAMMDISDGLALDLHRMCAGSGCDAELDEDSLAAVVSPAALAAARRDGRPVLEHVLGDGEDFELLVAAGEGMQWQRLGLMPLGRMVPRGDPGRPALYITNARGDRWKQAPIGYEHLRR